MEATRSSSPPTAAAMENGPLFDYFGSDGAMALLHRIHSKEPFTDVRSICMTLMPGDDFDDFDDDMWASALYSIHPGNISHALAYVRIVINGNILFERNSHRVANPVGSRDANPQLNALLSANTKERSQALEELPLMIHYYERAVIRALCGIRGVAKVDICGPMEPRLRQQIVGSMTSPVGIDPAPLDDDVDAVLAADGLWGFLDAKNTDKSIYFNTNQPAVLGDGDGIPLSSLPPNTSSPTPSIRTRDTHVQHKTEIEQLKDEDDNDSNHTDASSVSASDSDFKPDARITSRKGFTTRRVTRALLTPSPASKKRKLTHKNSSSSDSSSGDKKKTITTINPSSSPPTSATQTSAQQQPWQPRLAVINVQRQDIHDFGDPSTADPSNHMPWFDPDSERETWILPTGKGARVCIGKFVGKE